MARKRKTFNVEQFKAEINYWLLHSRDDQRGERRGNASALENVLHATGNYRGFGYLNAKDMENSEYGSVYSRGINTLPKPAEDYEDVNERATLWFTGTDDSRRHYY